MGGVHLNAYANIPEVEVVGVADASRESAAAGAELVGARPYASYGELVAAEDVEVVDICLPTVFHRDLALRAAGEGRLLVLLDLGRGFGGVSGVGEGLASLLGEAAQIAELFLSCGPIGGAHRISSRLALATQRPRPHRGPRAAQDRRAESSHTAPRVTPRQVGGS